jgi:nucleoside 2-deoxyribosyltransferase
MIKQVYLSGGIFEVEDPGTWRDELSKALPAEHWQAVNPLDFDIRAMKPTAIVRLDKSQILMCHALVARTHKPSWGTAMEILFAYQCQIPVICWVPDTASSYSPWLIAHAHVFVDHIDDVVTALQEKTTNETSYLPIVRPTISCPGARPRRGHNLF